MRNVSAPEIDVWVVSTQDFLSKDLASDLIGESERARASRTRVRPDQDTFTRGYATIRTILAEYLSLQAGALRFGRGRFGKPFLLGQPDLHFSWSHAGDCWILAVSFAGPVGADVEKVRTDFDWRGPADIAFHPNELRYIERDTGRAAWRFFDLWTRKEAAFKGIGTGLHDDMAGTSLVDDAGALKGLTDMLDGTRWQTHAIAVAGGYAAAAAGRFPGGLIRTRTYVPRLAAVDRETDRLTIKRCLHQHSEIVA